VVDRKDRGTSLRVSIQQMAMKKWIGLDHHKRKLYLEAWASYSEGLVFPSATEAWNGPRHKRTDHAAHLRYSHAALYPAERTMSCNDSPHVPGHFLSWPRPEVLPGIFTIIMGFSR
jgi:hypothetical protein